MISPSVREERPADYARIDAIQRAAFGRPQEAALVRALRESASPRLSLVAELGGAVVGHVFLSPVTIEGERPSPAVGGLAPLAVDPPAQGGGVGAALMRAGVEACAQVGWQAIFLLGDPAYYSRFGFELAAPRGLHYESEVFDVAFQVKELVPGALSGHAGWVGYHAAFADL